VGEKAERLDDDSPGKLHVADDVSMLYLRLDGHECGIEVDGGWWTRQRAGNVCGSANGVVERA
jgi:hypothetical protein